MKKLLLVTATISCLAIMATSPGLVGKSAAQSPIDPCLECHGNETPDIVKQWESGKHSKTGVKCYVCHFSEAGNADGMEHNGFFVLTKVDVKTCDSCHPDNAQALRKKFSNGKHP